MKKETNWQSIGAITISNDHQLKESNFGPFVEIDMPQGCEAVIICRRIGAGPLTPFWLCLPHQVYLNTIVKDFFKTSATEYTLIPVNPNHYS